MFKSIEKKSFMSSRIRFWIFPKRGITMKPDRTIKPITPKAMAVRYLRFVLISSIFSFGNPVVKDFSILKSYPFELLRA